MAKFDDWTEKDIQKYTKNYKEQATKTKKRLDQSRISADVFLSMLERFMQGKVDVYYFNQDKLKQNSALYLHGINLYWGMDYELILVKSQERSVLIHFGNILS